MRKVDKLGRIVIPLSLRQKYGLSEGAELEFLDGGNGVVVRNAEPFCRICREKIDADLEIPLCDVCIRKVLKKYK